MDLRQRIRDVPDFPEPGIVFKDITPLLQDPVAFRQAIFELSDRFARERIDVVVGIEARGFLFGAPLALNLDAPFVPIRKKGKLPHKTVGVTYSLEYGAAAVEMHQDGVMPGKRVLIVDDVLATGGTMAAARALVEQVEGHVVALAVLIELEFLKGREKLAGVETFSLMKY